MPMPMPMPMHRALALAETPMKVATVLVLAAALALVAGCANLERSRDLANPKIAAVTLAQQVCVNCHGANGNSISPNFPKLAGQMAPYIVAQLNGFKSHDRHDPDRAGHGQCAAAKKLRHRDLRRARQRAGQRPP